MGDLPACRVQWALPFEKVGVDYAGPFMVKERRGRGCKVIKCWVSVFIYLITRAINLETVLSISSDDFLQALNRFIGRRGKPLEMFSDNGTNVIKANKDLQSMGHFLQNNNDKITQLVEVLRIKWHFIPPNSSHFGSIWEAGVKSLKYHLKRVVGSYTLLIFDLQRLLVRIEAVLNSRPLSPLSSHPEDYYLPPHIFSSAAVVRLSWSHQS
ncbi:uncharacterized protein LOC126737571 [Anthonomus grandis grandis]|uniref:uncharacterized protein LOC126737571 n=1 Tax=Anthonomus grandis grandis TaxID=2921223 RepID=UPI0021665441|nr:uncharacterized protein LOC126737571 [Anthonomus grandis grandis]